MHIDVNRRDPAYEEDCRALRESLAPEGFIEEEAVQWICDYRWRLRRISAWDNAIEITFEGATPLTQPRAWREKEKALARLDNLRKLVVRGMQRNLKRLKVLQKDRRAAGKITGGITQLPQVGRRKEEMFDPRSHYPFQLAPPKFVFSPAEIARTAAHLARLSQSGFPMLERLKGPEIA